MAKSEQELLDFQRRLEAEKAKIFEERRQLEEQRSQLAKESQELARNRNRSPAALHSSNGHDRTGTNMSGMMGTIGCMREFILTEDFEVWYEQFQEYIAANNISMDRSVPLFLTLLGTDGYKLIRNLCVPCKPREKTLIELVTLIQNHLNPKPNVISERFKFKQRKQKQDESISMFVAALKQISLNCEFGGNLNNSLRDQLVWGLRNARIQRRLLSETQLPMERAVELSLSLEAAEREAGQLSQASHNLAESSVNFLAKRGKPTGQHERVVCYCCGKPNHKISECRFKDYACNICHKKGHLAIRCKNANKFDKAGAGKSPVAKSVPSKRANKHNFIEEDLSESFGNLFQLHSDGEKPITIQLAVEGKQTTFEIDSGSPISAISVEYLQNTKEPLALQMNTTTRIFRTYSGGKIISKGYLTVDVAFKGRNVRLNLFVLPGDSAPIIGRDWLYKLHILKVDEEHKKLYINSVKNSEFLSALRDKFKNVFSKKLGTCTSHKFALMLKQDAKPVFFKPRPVPFAMRHKIEQELDRLIEGNIIEPVDNSNWATPIVPVVKSDGTIRLCGDYKVTVNPHLIVNRHPIPRVTDLLNKLGNGTVFSKIDLAHAYQQVELEQESKALTTITTHKGLFRYNRMSFGIASAPGLSQNLVDKILAGLPGVVVYFDDILVFGGTLKEHNERLEQVLHILERTRLTVSFEKCSFAEERVHFLGYQLDRNGVHIAPEKVRAIKGIMKPTNVTELKSFLGIINYYSKFIKSYSTIAAPLFHLLRKNVKYKWSTDCDKAFKTN